MQFIKEFRLARFTRPKDSLPACLDIPPRKRMGTADGTNASARDKLGS